MTFLATVTIAADTDTTRSVNDAAVGNFLVQLSDLNGNVLDTRFGTELTYTFPGLVAGDYTVSAQLQDVNGATIGGISSTTFNATEVPPETVTVKTVSAVSVVIAVEPPSVIS